MKTIRSLLCAVLLLATPAIAAASKPLKVFILTGQSNMEGQAFVDLEGKDYNEAEGRLAALLRDPARSAAGHQTNSIEGWTVLVNERLLARLWAVTK